MFDMVLNTPQRFSEVFTRLYIFMHHITIRSYESISENYFCVRHKNRRKHNQHFKLLFFKEKLHCGTSVSIYGKLNLLTIKNICLVFSSRERQRRLIQTKLFYSLWKETCQKALKAAAAKKSFPSVYIIDKFCFDHSHNFYGHKKQIVWKHGSNWPFYAFMLRTKLY